MDELEFMINTNQEKLLFCTMTPVGLILVHGGSGLVGKLLTSLCMMGMAFFMQQERSLLRTE